MNLHYFLKLVFIIFQYISTISFSSKKCKYFNQTYEIGDEYSDKSDVCRLCKCNNDGINSCKNVLDCQKLECEQNYEYESKCCSKLNCSGIVCYNKNTLKR